MVKKIGAFILIILLHHTIQTKVIEVYGKEQFEQLKQQHPQMVVKFYAPNCPGCMGIQKPYKKLSKRFKENNIPFIAIDVSDKRNKELSEGIEYWPQVHFITKGQMTQAETLPHQKSLFKKEVKQTFGLKNYNATNPQAMHKQEEIPSHPAVTVQNTPSKKEKKKTHSIT